MAVTRLKVEQVTPQEQAPSQNLLLVYKAIAQVLAIRLFILLAVVGSFYLSYFAMGQENTHSLWALGIYCFFTILPLVYLEIVQRLKS